MRHPSISLPGGEWAISSVLSKSRKYLNVVSDQTDVNCPLHRAIASETNDRIIKVPLPRKLHPIVQVNYKYPWRCVPSP